jgi:hypothetical protein
MKSAILAVVLTVVAAGLWIERLPALTSFDAQHAAGSNPSPLRLPYKSERDWAIHQTVLDIREMAGKSDVPSETDLAALTPWNVDDKMVAFAAAQLESGAAAVAAPRDQHPALLQATAANLFAASEDVSKELKRNVRNPRGHEAAAMVLAAFGMQEAADDLSDHRWVMNRMTAHLAVAAALRTPNEAMSLDGQIATAALATLANRQAAALDLIARLGDPQRASTSAAWQRALMLRITQDWRLLKAPIAATRLEKLEYFRARRATLRGRVAREELATLKELDSADFGRIVQSYSAGVDDGNHFIADSVVRELKELAVLYQREFDRTLPAEIPDAINERAGRLMTNGQPRVLPWGAWAEFSQRHIAMAIADSDKHYREMLGLPDHADELNEAIDGVLSEMRMFSVASTSRRLGRKATEADLTYFTDALDVLATAPELIPPTYWTFFETAAAHERMSGRVPGALSWFIPPSPAVPYAVGTRLNSNAVGIEPFARGALLEAAPFDVWVLSMATRSPSAPELVARAKSLIADRAAYDLWAIDNAVAAAQTRQAWEPHLRRGCELAAVRCLTLAKRLESLDEHAAAVAYERAFNDPTLDRVMAANNAWWLVSYYERRQQPQKATALAEAGAEVGSASGLRSMGRLLEQRGEVVEAAKFFEAMAERYPIRRPWLLGYLYRRAVIHKDARFTARWEEVSRAIFPQGLLAVTASPASPSAGVFVSKDSSISRAVRLQVGDIIVGVNGWRVDNKEQLDAVVGFDDPPGPHRMTAWRGVLFSVELPAEHGMTLDTYPLRGWVE